VTSPDYQTMVLPLLHFAADGRPQSTREAIKVLTDEFKLINDECKVDLVTAYSSAYRERRILVILGNHGGCSPSSFWLLC
jgi:restriction endonuclease Mrr